MSMKLVKRSLLLLGAVLLVTLPAYSQNDDVFGDDIYTSRKASRKQHEQKQTQEWQGQDDEYVDDEQYATASDKDIDAYNRRGGQTYEGKQVAKDEKRKTVRSSVPGRYSRRLARFYKPNTIIISDVDNVYVTDDGERFAYGDDYYYDDAPINVYVNVNSPWYDPFPYTAWYPSFLGWYNYTWNYPWFYYGSHIGWGGYYPGHNWYWSWGYNPYHNPYGIGMGWGYYGWGSYYGWGGYPGPILHHHHYYHNTYSSGQHSGAYYSNGRPNRPGTATLGKVNGRLNNRPSAQTSTLQNKPKLTEKETTINSGNNNANVRPGRLGRGTRVEGTNVQRPVQQVQPKLQQNNPNNSGSSGRNVRTDRQTENRNIFSTPSSRNSNNSGGFSTPSRSSGSVGGGARSSGGGGRSGRN